jgi:HAD superfamily hydrolase (TIGR01509 family)
VGVRGTGESDLSTIEPGSGGRRLQAVIFDVDGTLADTEREGHRPAFNEAFVQHGLDIEWDPEHYGRLLEITGGRRRVAADLRERGYGEDEADRIAAEVHKTKTALFVERVIAGRFPARPGVTDLVDGLVAAGVRIAVATTGRRDWALPLVTGLLGDVVEVMITGDEVTRLKPDPEAYLLALAGLGLDASAALAVEDSAVGLTAAAAAGLATVVVTNGYTAGQDFGAAAALLPAYDGEQPLTAEACVAVHDNWWTDRRTTR